MRRKNIYFLVLFLLLFTGQLNAQRTFILEGVLTGVADSTKIMMCPSLSNMDMDRDKDIAIIIKNGKFRFERKIDAPTKFSLRILPKIPSNVADYEFVYFWAENKPMFLKGEKGNLLYSNITGSEIQDQYMEYMNVGKSRELENKRLKDSVFIYKIQEKDRMPIRKARDENIRIILKERLDFIYNHPNYLCCEAELVLLINTLPKNISKVRATEFYQNLSNDFKNNTYGKQIKHFIDSKNEDFVDLKMGDKPYEFCLPDSTGMKLALSSLKGKIILLDFWDSGCGPCRLEHKNYLEAYKKFQSHGFEILSVSRDQSKRSWLNAMQKDNMIWMSVRDSDKTIIKMYNVSYLPTNYLISKEGIIIDKDLRGDKLLKKLDMLIYNGR